MQDFQPTAPLAEQVSGKIGSAPNTSTNTNNSNNTNNNNNNTSNDTESQGAIASFKRYLPVVKWVGNSTKEFFVSGQFKRTIRSPIQFVNPRHLSLPATFGDALTRLAKNWTFYKSNYTIITFLCCFAWIFSSPNSLIILAILGLLWSYVIKTSGQVLKIGETQYGSMQKYMFAILVTLIATLFFGIISTIVGGVSVGTGISSLHAICHVRPETEHERLRDLNDIENDTTSTTNNKISSTTNGQLYDADTTNVNGIEIMQFDDAESSFVVNEGNTQNNDIDRMIDNDNNGNNNDGTPELGIH